MVLSELWGSIGSMTSSARPSALAGRLGSWAWSFARKTGSGAGRQLLESLQDVAASLGHPRTWVATGDEAVGFYLGCGWAAVEHLRLESTGILTTILTKPT